VCRVLRNVTDVFVEVSPRHERFYRGTFGFTRAAGRQICPRVMAPAVLLRLELERIDARFAALVTSRRTGFDGNSWHSVLV
jgi:hypothetical protein